jgi:anthranilate phosphoribosyltransferase
MIRENIQTLVEGESLSFDESRQVMNEIMTGQATNAQIGAFLTALRMKGETAEELVAFSQVMREHCFKISPKVEGRLVDTCGTGGDEIKTFNISTASAFVVAGVGASIAKHGNRAITSKSGSADALERLGFNLNMQPTDVEKAIEQTGIGFLFAPAFHPAMKYAALPRKEVGIRTIFNLLGPLTNPASANAQLLGVYDKKLIEPLAKALRSLGCEEAMVIHGLDGLDEISTSSKTIIAHLKMGQIVAKEVAPKDFGVKKVDAKLLQGSSPDENATTLFNILSGRIPEDDPKVEVVLVNSAAGLIVGNRADDFSDGMELARESIRSGLAYKKLKALIKASKGDLDKLEGMEKYE